MELIHNCGWEGKTSELLDEYYQGILYGRSCPRCGGEWPFFYDEDFDEDDNEEEEYYGRHF